MFGSVRWILTAGVWAFVAVACSDASSPAAPTEPTPVVTVGQVLDPAPEPEPAPEPVVESDTTANAPDGDEAGIVYFELDGMDLTMDVRVPEPGVGAGRDRPIVVLFHGLSSETNDAADITLVAEAAAAAGMVVFAPEWIGGDPFPVVLDDITKLRRIGECAVAFAQSEAARFGAAADRTVTSGFSAGTSPALTAATAPVSGRPVPGCASGAVTDAVVGTVLGDGEYFWQSEPFDGAFAADPAGMLAETGLLIEPSDWTNDPAFRIHLWAAADRTAPRSLATSASGDDWLTARDAAGTIRSELEAAGALEDESIDYLENATLLAQRATAAGFDVDSVVYPGGHTTDDKVPAIVEHLVAVAAAS